MSKEGGVFYGELQLINSRVALRVVIPGSIHISVAYLLADLFLHVMQTNCGGHRLGRSRGERPRLEPDVMGGKLPDGSTPFYPEKTELSERANLSGDTKEQVYE